MKVLPAMVSVLMLGLGVGSVFDWAMPAHNRVVRPDSATFGEATELHVKDTVSERSTLIEPDHRSAAIGGTSEQRAEQKALTDTFLNCSSGTKACGSSCISIDKTCHVSEERPHVGIGCGKSHIAAGKICHGGSKHKKRYKASSRIAKLKLKQ